MRLSKLLFQKLAMIIILVLCSNETSFLNNFCVNLSEGHVRDVLGLKLVVKTTKGISSNLISLLLGNN